MVWAACKRSGACGPSALKGDRQATWRCQCGAQGSRACGVKCRCGRSAPVVLCKLAQSTESRGADVVAYKEVAAKLEQRRREHDQSKPLDKQVRDLEPRQKHERALVQAARATEADQVHFATAASLAVAQAARPGLREMYQQPPREPRAKQHAFEQRSALVPAAAPPQLGRAGL